MDRKYFIDALEMIKEKVLEAGGDVYSFEIGEPGSKEFVSQVEAKYGICFPSDFVQFVTSVSGKVDIAW